MFADPPARWDDEKPSLKNFLDLDFFMDQEKTVDASSINPIKMHWGGRMYEIHLVQIYKGIAEFLESHKTPSERQNLWDELQRIGQPLEPKKDFKKWLLVEALKKELKKLL